MHILTLAPHVAVLECLDGSIIVTDIDLHQVVVVSANGATKRTIGSFGSNLGQFNFPFSLAYSQSHAGTGGVLVREVFNDGRVQLLPNEVE